MHGAALQCRITTEDPANGFRPDTGRITAYRIAGRRGHPARRRHAPGRRDQRALRLDAGQADLPRAATSRRRSRRARRAVAEFRIRGVSTNIPFLQAVLDDPDFRAGRVTTSFIDERPQLLTARTSGRPRHQDPQLPGRRDGEPAARAAAVDGVPARQAAGDRPRRRRRRRGRKQRLTELGPEGFARWLRESQGRRRHRHHVPRCAPVAAGHPGAHHRPADGRALHRADDAAAVVDRVLGRRDLRCGASVPEGGPVGAAGRAAGGGAQHLPADAAARPQHRRLHAVPGDRSRTAFVDEATATGIDIFRIFDALNNVESMRPAIDAVRETGTAVAEVAMCYTGDLSDPGENLYTLDYYLKLAEQIVDAGAHVLAIKDMAGLLRAAGGDDVGHARCAAGSTCRCTCTPTTPPAVSWPPTWRPGRPAPTPSTAPPRRWRAPPASRRCRRSSPPRRTPSTTPGCRWRRCATWSRTGRRCERCTRRSSPGCPRRPAGCITHEIPGGQLSNLRQQAIALGLGDRFEEIEDNYAAADRMLGRLVKVTPSSKVVGDLALALVGAGCQRRRVRRRPGAIRHPRLGDRVPARRAGRPARRLAGAVAHQGAGRARAGQARAAS